jgi:hypothetical protein
MSCPICGKPATPGYRPFCSRRCADVDLGRWLTEGYRIPADDADDPTKTPTETPPEDRPPKAH